MSYSPGMALLMFNDEVIPSSVLSPVAWAHCLMFQQMCCNSYIIYSLGTLIIYVSGWKHFFKKKTFSKYRFSSFKNVLKIIGTSLLMDKNNKVYV